MKKKFTLCFIRGFINYECVVCYCFGIDTYCID